MKWKISSLVPRPSRPENWTAEDLGMRLENLIARVNITHQYTDSGKLLRKKLSRIVEKYDFHGENFHGLLACAAPKDATPQNFAEKTFTNSHKTTKFAKVFSLESFPLYGTYLERYYTLTSHGGLTIVDEARFAVVLLQELPKVIYVIWFV